MFIAADSFVKAFRVRRQRIMNYPQTTPIEEVNYATLAIRFTNNLTKDMVFTGIKDIIQKIGFMVDRGIDFDIKFSFGTLHCKERRLKFDFDQNRIQQVHHKPAFDLCPFETNCSNYSDALSVAFFLFRFCLIACKRERMDLMKLLILYSMIKVLSPIIPPGQERLTVT